MDGSSGVFDRPMDEGGLTTTVFFRFVRNHVKQNIAYLFIIIYFSFIYALLHPLFTIFIVDVFAP